MMSRHIDLTLACMRERRRTSDTRVVFARAFSSRGKANLRVGSRLVVPASYDGPISPRYKYEP